MSADVDGAIDAALADLHATTDLSVEAQALTGSDGRLLVTIGDTSFGVPASSSGAELMVALAGQLQDVVAEELAQVRASNWPICPRHRSTHPLQPLVIDARGVWVCPDDGVAVADIGRLRP